MVMMHRRNIDDSGRCSQKKINQNNSTASLVGSPNDFLFLKKKLPRVYRPDIARFRLLFIVRCREILS